MIKIVYIILLYMNLLSSMNADSGAWLQAGMIHTKFVITNDEFISAMCRPNTFENSIIPKLTPVFYRSVKSIDHFGYHMVDCKVGANAIRLYDEVVITLASLLKSTHIDPVVEPLQLFDSVPDLDDRRRPDILIRNTRGFAIQVILKVAVTGVHSQSRVDDNDPDKPLGDRYKQ